MNSINPNFKKPHYDNNKKVGANHKGRLVAAGTAFGILSAANTSTLIPAEFMEKTAASVKGKDVQTLIDASEKVLNELSDLSKKRVTIQNYDRMPRNFTWLPQKIFEKTNPYASIALGRNAFYVDGRKTFENEFQTNCVIINKEKMGVGIFHELGHAHNWNKTRVMRFLQDARGVSVKTAKFIALLPALTKEEKPKDGAQELTKFQKFKNGLRKASPFIALGFMAPTIIEESSASLKGVNWAKKVLDPNLTKKVKLANVHGLTTYAIQAAGIFLASLAGLKVKDKMDERKAQKLENKA